MKAEELATSRKKGFSYNITSLWKEIIHSYRVLPSTKITKCPRVHIQKKKIQPTCSIAALVTFHPGWDSKLLIAFLTLTPNAK